MGEDMKERHRVGNGDKKFFRAKINNALTEITNKQRDKEPDNRPKQSGYSV